MIDNYLLGCDWGTSSFRLRLINRSDRKVVAEVLSEAGIASTYTDWKDNGDTQGVNRLQFFKSKLRESVAALSAKADLTLTGVPIVISGMASSSIGMDDVPYAELPFSVDGSECKFRFYAEEAHFSHSITLVSGVKAEKDVMRGEETQLVGLMSLLDKSIAAEKTILIFPGTHSKHLYVSARKLVDIQTFMTGEVFSLMANSSVLKNSVKPTSLSAFSKLNEDAFRSGVQESLATNALSSLFSVRTNELFGKLTEEQNFFYLSGLLIGAELKGLPDQKSWKFMLCSGSNLFELYRVAMEELQLSDRTTTIPAALIDSAAVAGQLNIFESIKPLEL